ncbi:aryl-sulfate sulfotransferase [Calditrichota bacterium]
MTVLSSAFALQGIHPPEGSDIVSKYVMFCWEPVEDVFMYQLQVAIIDDDSSFIEPVVDLMSDYQAILVKEGLDFGNPYFWRTRALTANLDTLEWSNLRFFSIIDLPDSIRYAFIPNVYVPERMEPGINLISQNGILSVIESSGEVVWHQGGRRGWWRNGNLDFRQLKNGNFSSLHDGYTRIFDIYNETIWTNEDEIDRGAHHTTYQKADGNVIYLYPRYEYIGEGEDRRLYQGDIIIEMNEEYEIVWSWDCFDYLSTEDVDQAVFDASTPNGRFDWTHSNACPMDRNEENIYLSVRNLSRIIKIAYPSGEIQWSMGKEAVSGDLDFGEDLNFIHQHCTDPLEDGKLLFFDNHVDDEKEFSRAMVVDIDPDREEPVQLIRQHYIPFSEGMGSSYYLSNENILINTGSTVEFYEFTSDSHIVWKVEPDLTQASYQIKRIKHLYPLAFVVNGPADSSIIESLNTSIAFQICNVGEASQFFHYTFADSLGWFEVESGIVEILPGQHYNMVAFGFVPQLEDWNTLVLTVTPSAAPDISETYSINVLPDEFDWVSEESIFSPAKFAIQSCYPNPFNSTTRLSYTLPRSGQVTVNLFDIAGREVRLLNSGYHSSGIYELTLDGTNLSSGMYILKLESKGMTSIRNVLLTR